MRPPSLVKKIILEAIYNVHLLSFETGYKFDEGFELYKEIRSKFEPLLKFSDRCVSEEILKLFMYELRFQANPSREIFSTILEYPFLTEETKLIVNGLASFIDFKESKPNKEPNDRILGFFNDGLFAKCIDELFIILTSDVHHQTLNIEHIIAVFNSFNEIESKEYAEKIASILHLLPKDLLDNLSTRKLYKSTTEKIDQLIKNPIPDIIAWFSNLNSCPDPIALRKTLKNCESEWNIDDFVNGNLKVRDLVDIIEQQRSENGNIILADEMTGVVSHIKSLELPDSQKNKVFIALLSSVYISSLFRNEIKTAVNDLASHVLNHKTSDSEKEELLSILKALWSENETLNNINWGIELIDIIAINLPDNDSSKFYFINLILASVLKFHSRISERQKFLLASLLSFLPNFEDWMSNNFQFDLNAQFESESTDFHLPVEKLEKYKIGIYSRNTVGTHVQNYFKSLQINATILLNSNDVGGKMLDGFVSSSDLIVYVWGSAAHTVFFAIKRKLARYGTKFVYASSTGLMGVLEAIEKGLELLD